MKLDKVCSIFLTVSLSMETVLGHGFLKSLQFSRHANGNIMRRLFEVSVEECVKECGLRLSCVTCNYHRAMALCELISTTADPVVRKAWVTLKITEDIRREIMEKHCNNRDDCATGQKCTKRNDNTYRCTIEECGLFDVKVVQMFPPRYHMMHHIGAKIKVVRDRSLPAVDMYCCFDGLWREDCGGADTPSTTTTATTTTTLEPTTTTTLEATTTTTTVPSTSSPVTATIEWRSMMDSVVPRDIGISSNNAMNWQAAMDECTRHNSTLAHVYGEGDIEIMQTWSIDHLPDEVWLGGEFDPNDNEWYWMPRSNNFPEREPVDHGLWENGIPPGPDAGNCIYLVRFPLDFVNIAIGPCTDVKHFMCQANYVTTSTSAPSTTTTTLAATTTTLPQTSTVNSNIDWWSMAESVVPRDIGISSIYTMDWKEALNECKRLTATLAHVYGQEDIKIIMNIWPPDNLHDEIWLGGHFEESTNEWYWMPLSDDSPDREPVDTTLWENGWPPVPDMNAPDSGNCIYLSKISLDYVLAAGQCSDSRPFMCQGNYVTTTTAVPTTTTTTLAATTTVPSTSSPVTATIEWRSMMDSVVPRDIGISSNNAMTWQAALDECNRLTASLAHVYGQVDVDILRTWPADDLPDEAWLGGWLHEDTGEWSWLPRSGDDSGDVEPVDPTLWGDEGQPPPDRDNCLYLTKVVIVSIAQLVPAAPNYVVNAGPCVDVKPFMCQGNL